MTLTHSGPQAAPLQAARLTLDRACEHLASLQHEPGWWQGELETNVTMDAEDLLLRQFLGVRTEADTAAAARWIRSKQRADGTWANFHGGPGDLSTTVEAYVALRLADDAPDEPHMATAARWIRAQGGIEATRVFTRIWLAMFGQWSWDDLPVIPPELIYLPAWFPLNVYDWACWARQTIVPLAVVASFRPSRPLPFSLPELFTGVKPSADERDPWAMVFNGLDKALHTYQNRALGARRHHSTAGLSAAPNGPRPTDAATLEQHASGATGFRQWSANAATPVLPARRAVNNFLRLRAVTSASPGRRRAHNPAAVVRRAALRRCADWIIARQEQDGCWGGIQPPWVYSLIALHLLGYRLDHPVLARGIAGLERFMIREDGPDGPTRRMEACQSPVWDTVLAMVALGDAGLKPDDPVLTKAADWVLSEEIPGPGDWQVRRPDLEPGGWAFEFDNDGYPDTDDTAEVILALRKVWPAAPPEDRAERAIDRGIRWLIGMQSKDGGWGAFDADNVTDLVNKLPFCDFGAVIDPPSADVTAHIVEALAGEGMADSEAARRGVVWLLKAQESDGSWFGRWGANYVYGTGAVVPALIAAGVRPDKPCIRRAVAWLEQHQNADGGWGEDLRSYDDPGLAGQGESTASQTAWALLALLAADGSGSANSRAVRRGIGWLGANQRADGGWDEPQYTGTGFPGDFYINYHLYRLVFPVSALGRYLRIAEGAA
jgi:squalene-hopene/tetraprenyl-beta-curcumene cyclase